MVKTNKKLAPKQQERVNFRILRPTYVRLMLCKAGIQKEMGISKIQACDLMELLMSGKYLKITKKIHDDKNTLTAD